MPLYSYIVNWSGRRLQFTDLLYARVCGVILPGSRLSKRCAREKTGYVTVQRNGCHPFSIRSSSFLFPFKVRSFPCFLNRPPVKWNGQGKFFLTRTVLLDKALVGMP